MPSRSAVAGNRSGRLGVVWKCAVRRWFRFGAVWGGLETAKACGRFGRFVLAFLGSLRPAGLGGLEFGGVRWRFGFAINATPAKRIGRFASRCRPWPVCPKSNCRPLCGEIWSILVDSGQFWSILVSRWEGSLFDEQVRPEWSTCFFFSLWWSFQRPDETR